MKKYNLDSFINYCEKRIENSTSKPDNISFYMNFLAVALKNEIEAIKEIIPTKTLNPSKEKELRFNKGEVQKITETLRHHADLYSNNLTMTEWCKERYNLSSKIMKNFENQNSEKKGFESNNIKKAIAELSMAEVDPNPHHYIAKAIKYLKDIQANGEKPEEVNPVGQVDYYKLLDNFLEIHYPHNSVFKGQAEIYIKDFIKNVLINKPLTTTKEQPKNLCECCKTELAVTAKNMCEQCSKYW